MGRGAWVAQSDLISAPILVSVWRVRALLEAPLEKKRENEGGKAVKPDSKGIRWAPTYTNSRQKSPKNGT